MEEAEVLLKLHRPYTDKEMLAIQKVQLCKLNKQVKFEKDKLKVLREMYQELEQENKTLKEENKELKKAALPANMVSMETHRKVKNKYRDMEEKYFELCREKNKQEAERIKEVLKNREEL